MTTTPNPCTTGCTQPGYHQPNCRDSTCPGCQPRPTHHGLICGTCYGRLARATETIPDLIIHIRSLIPPGSSKPSRDKLPIRPTTEAPPAPGNATAMDAADTLWAWLAYWVVRACTDLGLRGPDLPPSWRITWPDGTSTIAGLVAGSTGHETTPVARWLTAHLELVARLPWVSELLAGDNAFVDVVRAAARAYPLRDRPTRPVNAPCPACDMKGLLRRGPQIVGDDETITCSHCNTTVDLRLYDGATNTLITPEAAAQLYRGTLHDGQNGQIGGAA